MALSEHTSNLQLLLIPGSFRQLPFLQAEGEICTDGICADTEIMTCEEAGELPGCKTVGEEVAESKSPWLFQKYGVDVYNAGHSVSPQAIQTIYDRTFFLF